MSTMEIQNRGIDVQEGHVVRRAFDHPALSWSDSSWDLMRGLEVTEGLPLDELASLFARD